MSLILEVLRVLVALPVAPLVAATLFTGIEWVTSPAWPGIELDAIAFLWPVTFIVALGHAVALGLPAYLLLRWIGWTRWWVSLPSGFAIGALPFVIYFFPNWTGVGSFTQEGDRVVESGATTLAAWLDFAEIAGGLGLLGMVSASAAWLTWHGLERLFARPRVANA